MESELKSLLAQRKSLKMKLTLFKKFVTSLSSNTDIIDLEKRVQKNESLLENFNDIQTQIEILILDDQNEETYLEERESFENTYYSTIAAAERHIRKFKVPDQPTSIASCSPVISESQSTPRLPVIKLPTFNGNLGDWIRFRDTFVSLVHNCDKLTDIDRFNYLTSTLTGPASRVIESLGVSEINYKIAWTRLKERYENPNALAYYHLNGLLNIVPVKKSDGVALIEFIDTANNHVHALESLMSPTEIWNALINSYLIKLLDFTTTDEWEKRTVDATARPTFHDLSKFIEQRAQYLSRRNISNASASGQLTDRAPKQGNAKIRPYAAHLVNINHACLLCKGEHALFQCSKLLAMPFSERHETVKRLQACFNCLQLGHSISNCTRGTCRKCNKRHHTLLHKDINETSVNLKNNEQNASHPHTLQACVIDQNNPTFEYTVLSTAIIYVLDSNGNSHKCRALLDVGSQAHFVTEDFCSRINIPRSETEAMIGGVGKVANPIKLKASLSISSRCNTFRSRLSCFVIKNITEDMPNISLDKKRIPIPPGKPLADPGFQEQGRIDLLIGAGLFWQLLCIGQYKVPESNLVWQKTRFGWVLGGSFNCLGKPECRTCHAVTNANLHKVSSRFWKIEETIQPGGVNFTFDNDCEQHFTKTTTRDDKGRYTVSIPSNNKLLEVKQSHLTHLATSSSPESTFDLFSRYSSLPKLLRITAYCLRFTRNARGNSNSDKVNRENINPPTATELRKAEETIIKIVQQSSFTIEIDSLSKGKPISKGSRLVSLNPFLDELGIIRVGGRLTNAPVPFNAKHPVVLPTSHPFTNLVIKNEHLRSLHAGPQQTLASLRDRFWILSGRRIVRKIVRQCFNCFRAKPLTINYQMGNLPSQRVTPSRAFDSCGVDYAGPFLIREGGRGRVARKTYVCIFVCLVTKAIHIELATDLSTDSFLKCLHRFISRRGRCHSIYSDNGKNFIGARNQLNELGILLNTPQHNSRVQSSLAREGIEWHLIPPYAPHFGGLWERGVKSVKTHLKRVVGEQRLTYEELYTVLTKIEACLNSRPLHPLSSDPNDLTPLTPGHFLIGNAILALPQINLLNIQQNRLNRYQLIQQMMQHFWKRWQREYLHELQQRHKWKLQSSDTIKVGDLVIVKEDNLPPLKWRLGRVTELHPGTDDITRVVTLKTADGPIKRPVTKICTFPREDTSN
ncbi:hypothetical protein ANTRET_LOCUS4277 [Anthophora retusa]